MTTNPSSGKEEDLNQGALDYNSRARTTLPCYVLTRVTPSAKKRGIRKREREKGKERKKEKKKETRNSAQKQRQKLNPGDTAAELQKPFNQM